MDKNLSYELQSNVPVQIVSADANLLARLFDNLINNAIKYGADGRGSWLRYMEAKSLYPFRW